MEVESLGFGEVLEQVIDLFVIDLQERAENAEALAVLGLVVFDFLEKGEDGPGDDACVVLVGDEVLEKGVLVLLLLEVLGDGVLPVAPEHRVRLARPCLPVREDRQIIALGDLTEVAAEMLENLPLALVLCDGLVKSGLDDRNGVSCDLDGLFLAHPQSTSYYTETTSLLPSSPPTSGRTRMNTFIAVDFYPLSFCINIIFG